MGERGRQTDRQTDRPNSSGEERAESNEEEESRRLVQRQSERAAHNAENWRQVPSQRMRRLDISSQHGNVGEGRACCRQEALALRNARSLLTLPFVSPYRSAKHGGDGGLMRPAAALDRWSRALIKSSPTRERHVKCNRMVATLATWLEQRAASHAASSRTCVRASQKGLDTDRRSNSLRKQTSIQQYRIVHRCFLMPSSHKRQRRRSLSIAEPGQPGRLCARAIYRPLHRTARI